jgi:hypothetical protein
MVELNYTPVAHDQEAFLAKARTRKDGGDAYGALARAYRIARQIKLIRQKAA